MVRDEEATSREGCRGFEGMAVSAFEALAATLFDGEVRAADVKLVEGTDPGRGREELAAALAASMERVGLTRDALLVRPDARRPAGAGAAGGPS